MDPFAKYLPAAKVKLDLSGIDTEEGLTKFCIEYLEKKGLHVTEALPSGKFEPENMPVIYRESHVPEMHVLYASYAVSKNVFLSAHNVKGLEIEVKRRLYHNMLEEIAKSDFAKVSHETDFMRDQRQYIMQLGVFKP